MLPYPGRERQVEKDSLNTGKEALPQGGALQANASLSKENRSERGYREKKRRLAI